MTNYNDGKWHGWNGGECPVHPKTVVEGVYLDEDGKPDFRSPMRDDARGFDWVRDGLFCLIAFRVVKEYREPLEWWLTNGKAFSSAREAKTAYPGSNPVHVREVQP